MVLETKNKTLKELREAIYAKIDELPTIPAVVAKVLALIEDEKTDAQALTRVISHDPSLTAKVLKVANSAYYGFPQTISGLDRAVALLGMNMVQSLALSIGVLGNLPKSKGPLNFSSQGLWLHSLAVATAMDELKKYCAKARGSDYLFVVGLLHDVGKIVLLHFFLEEYEKALSQLENENGSTLYLAERAAIGFDHGQVGAMLLDRWKFPREVIMPIAVHHHSKVPESANPRDTAMLKVADQIANLAGIGHGDEKAPPKIAESDFQILCLDKDDLAKVQASIIDSKESIESFFSSMSLA